MNSSVTNVVLKSPPTAQTSTWRDLITQEDVVVTLSHQGYVEDQPLSEYEAQRRGGKGKSAARMY